MAQFPFSLTTIGFTTDPVPGFANNPANTYTWMWGDGSPAQDGNQLSHTYPASGTYTVEVTVYCCNNPSEYKKFYHEVTVVCPCTVAALQNFPASGIVVIVAADPLCVTAVGTLAYPAGIDQSQYCVRWLWGDGTPPTIVGLGETALHSYAQNGVYSVCARILCCSQPLLSVLLECNNVTIDCNSPNMPQCEVFPSFYIENDAMGNPHVVSTTQMGAGTMQVSQSFTIEDDDMNIVAQYSCTADWCFEYQLPELPEGMYSVTITTVGKQNGEQCSLAYTIPLEYLAPVYPGDLDGNNFRNTGDPLIFMSLFGSGCN